MNEDLLSKCRACGRQVSRKALEQGKVGNARLSKQKGLVTGHPALSGFPTAPMDHKRDSYSG